MDFHALSKVNGTNGIVGAADTIWVLDNEITNRNTGETTTFLQPTGRDVEIPVEKFPVERDVETCRWERAEAAKKKDEKKAYEENELTQTIRDMLNKCPSGCWSGSATDILKEAQMQNRMRNWTPQNIGFSLSNAGYDAQLLEYDNIRHDAQTNGNAGKRHIFTLQNPANDDVSADDVSNDDTSAENSKPAEDAGSP